MNARDTAQTTSNVIVQILVNWGVDTIFGLPGDGINGVVEALRKNQDRIRFVQTRHEEAAAFAACGYAKVSGSLTLHFIVNALWGRHMTKNVTEFACRIAVARKDVSHITMPTGIQEQTRAIRPPQK
jgi:thiamine pyrophosphate-dependent acetolactate synthase large subunit-like protein